MSLTVRAALEIEFLILFKKNVNVHRDFMMIHKAHIVNNVLPHVKLAFKQLIIVLVAMRDLSCNLDSVNC